MYITKEIVCYTPSTKPPQNLASIHASRLAYFHHLPCFASWFHTLTLSRTVPKAMIMQPKCDYHLIIDSFSMSTMHINGLVQANTPCIHIYKANSYCSLACLSLTKLQHLQHQTSITKSIMKYVFIIWSLDIDVEIFFYKLGQT
jgi:hypothetical protein